MMYLIPSSMKHFAGLTLADGSNWNIIPSDDRAYNVVLALARVMRLQYQDKTVKRCDTFRRLIVQVEGQKIDPTRLSKTGHSNVQDKDTIVCSIISEENDEMHTLPLVHLSMVICRDAQHRGGVLLHGALAERNGHGVILAGPGGRGKSSASQRLPHHWHSFCDDTTLVVRDNKGVYWAHPWPTWSTFMFNGSGGTWDVQHSVPLKGIFFLDQAHKDAFKPLGTAQNVCLLIASAEQASWLMPGHSEKNALRELRLQRFDNICNLAQTIPSFILHICPDGAFWQEIERALDA